MAKELERGMAHYRDILKETFSRNPDDIPGSGAAGGLGAALSLFLGASMVSGAEELLGLSCFDEKIQKADLVITGEGRSDAQSGEGKITGSIVKHCARCSVPCAVLSGSLGKGWEILRQQGALAVYGAAWGEEIEKAMKEPAAYLKKAAEAFFRTWQESGK